jgi:hypothetical protein
MSNQEVIALTRYTRSLGALVDLGVPGAGSQKAAYEEILKLIAAEPLDIFEPALFSAAHSPAHSTVLQQLLASAQSAFAHRASKEEIADALEEFIRALSSDEANSLPETGIIISVARRWLRALQQESDEALLVLENRTSLDLAQLEEELSEEESARLHLSLSIVNRGISEADHIFLTIQVPPENLEIRIDRAEPKSAQEWVIPIGEKIRRNARVEKIIPITYKGAGGLNLWVKYSSVRRPALFHTSEVLEIRLAPSSEPAEGDDFANPYIPDLPLLSRSQWETLAMGSHPRLLENILNDQELPNGRLLVIRGCRRSGKTTLLRRIESELATSSTFLPVYIDLHSWHNELAQRQEPLNDEALLYEFACVILDVSVALLAESIGFDSIEMDRLSGPRGLLDNVREDMMLSRQSFEDFAISIEEALGRKILLIIDELDWWIHRSAFGGDVETILGSLAAPSARKKSFSALLSHDWTSKGWERKSPLTLLPRHVRFLRKEDIEKLSNAAQGVHFSGIAIDFIWRVSGGWPGLAQLVFYVSLEVLRQKAQGLVVDVGVVKAAVGVMLESQDYRRLLSYLLGSLTADELKLLKAMADLIDLESGEIKEIRFHSVSGYRLENPASLGEACDCDFQGLMESLKEKEIIEEAGGKSSKLRLRVGLLAYPRSFMELEQY